jgi:hypothetical protein
MTRDDDPIDVIPSMLQQMDRYISYFLFWVPFHFPDWIVLAALDLVSLDWISYCLVVHMEFCLWVIVRMYSDCFIHWRGASWSNPLLTLKDHDDDTRGSPREGRDESFSVVAASRLEDVSFSVDAASPLLSTRKPTEGRDE